MESALVVLRSPEEAARLDQVVEQVRDELNVRSVSTIDDESEVMEFSVQANMPLLGPKYGMEMRYIIEGLKICRREGRPRKGVGGRDRRRGGIRGAAGGDTGELRPA